MEITFYNNVSENNKIGKVLTDPYELEGTLRSQTEYISPVILFEFDPTDYNYLYIPDFKRYYFINKIEWLRDDLFNVYCSVDVLESFKDEILALTGIVDKQETVGNQFKDDGSIVMENRKFNQIYNFTNGFNNAGELILITAGANYVSS